MTTINHLSLLESLGLIHLAQAQPELQYLFRHALVHEATYHSLVKQDRQALHLAVGEALERLYPDRLAEFAPVLGTHFTEGEDGEKAVKYLSVAGDEAAGRYANTEACLHYGRALDILKQDPSLDADPGGSFVRLYLKRGRALELLGRYDQARDNYLEMQTLGQQRDDLKMALEALMALTLIYSTPSPVFDAEAGEACANEGLSLASTLGDQAAEAKILWALMLQNYFLLQPEKAREYGERSLHLARKLDLREQLAYTLSDLGNFAYMALGKFERAREVLEEAQTIWQELGNLPMLGNSLNYLSFVHFSSGELDLALKLADEAYRLSQSIGNLWGEAYSASNRSFFYLELGDFDQTGACAGEAIRLSDQSGFAALKPIVRTIQAHLYYELGAVEQAHRFALEANEEAAAFPFWQPVSLVTLAVIQHRRGAVEAAEQAVRRAQAVTDKSGMPMQLMYTSLAASELALQRGDPRVALDEAEGLVQRLRAARSRTFLPRALLFKARALLALGEAEQAEEALLQAHQLAETLTARRSWWKCLLLLAEVVGRRGDEAQAEAYRQQAAEIIAYIAERAAALGLKDSFLELAETI